MHIFLAFILGVILSVVGFYKYIAPVLPAENASQENVAVKVEILTSPTVTVSEINYEELTSEVYSLTSEEEFTEEIQISNTPTPTPTKKISKSTSTPTKKPTPTLTPTLTPTPTATPTQFYATPTPTSTTVKNYSSQEINSFIDRFSSQYAVDPNVLRHIAVCESNFNPYAKSYNGLYVGLYQFSEGAWEKYRKQMGENIDKNLRSDAEEAVQTAAYVMSVGESYIWPNCIP